MTLTPTFMGAEPRYADAGKYAGIVAFEDEERLGLEFARNLSAEQKRKAIFSDTLLPDRLPPGRHQGVDGLILGGRHKNSAIIPYEGIRGAELGPQQRQALLDLTQCYLSTLAFRAARGPHGRRGTAFRGDSFLLGWRFG